MLNLVARETARRSVNAGETKMPFSLHRFGKRAVCVALAAVALTGAARVGIGRYLSSSHGKTMVADRLGTALGMPVEVSEIELGDDTASFRFRVLDPADPKAEVLNVHSASADVTAADLMTGRVAPSALNLTGAQLTLRVGSGGRVLTPLPALPGTATAVPRVVITNGRVCIRQEGRPDFAVGGVNLALEPTLRTAEGSGDPSSRMVALTGTVNDPRWGAWTVRGELQRDTRTGWIELTNPDAPLEPELLASIPFAPPDLFDDVPTNTRAAVTVRLTVGDHNDVHPAVEIRYPHKVFGVPVETTFRLTPGSERYYFEPLP
jgi:hypothetical protein